MKRFLSQGTRNIKEKINKLNFTKNVNFYSLKDTVKKTEMQATKWEKISEICISQRFVSRMCKEILQLSKTAQFFKWTKDLNIHLTKDI